MSRENGVDAPKIHGGGGETRGRGARREIRGKKRRDETGSHKVRVLSEGRERKHAVSIRAGGVDIAATDSRLSVSVSGDGRAR